MRLLTILIFFFSSNYLISQTEVILEFPIDTNLWEIGGNASTVDFDGINGEDEILLTPNNEFQIGFIKYKNFVNFSQCGFWELDFEFRLWSDQPNSSGDGFAFCLLNQYNPGNAGANLGIPQNIGSLGLVVAFDTYDNCNSIIHDNPEIQISEIDAVGGFYYQENCYPTGNPRNIKLGTGNYNQDINILRSPNYRPAKINFYNNNVTVYVDIDNDGELEQVLGPTYLNLDYNYGMQMAFTAATGSFKDNQSIKNVKMTLETQNRETVRTELKCPNEDLEINGGLQYINYTWKNEIGDIIGNDQFLTVSEVGVYILEKEFFCGIEKEVITVIENDIAINNVSITNNCGYVDVLVEASGGEPNYLYEIEGVATLQASKKFKIYNPGQYIIRVRDNLHCYAEYFIEIESVPELLELNTQQISPNEITALVSGGTPPYQYQFENRTPTSSNIFEIPGPGNFTITAIDIIGCETSSTIEIECDSFEIPNFFSPNQDGINDFWFPKGLSCYPNLFVQIYDRHGRLLIQFRGDNSIGWDGTFNGKPLPSTDYWYNISLNKYSKPITGHFNLYR